MTRGKIVDKAPEPTRKVHTQKFPTCAACLLELRTPDEVEYHKYQCEYIPFCAQPGPQWFALTRDEREIYFGGSAGGGKSFLQQGFLMSMAVDRNKKGDLLYPGYRGAVIRVEYEYLKDWIDKASAMYGKMGAKTVGKPVEFRFPDGPIIRTGHLGDSDAWMKYQGWEIHKLGIDEVNQIASEETYLLLKSRCRMSPDGNPQILSTGNPSGVGDYWVRRRFVKLVGPDGKPHPANEPWTDPNTGDTRIFIPSRLSDNKVLERLDPNYRANLMGLPEKKRRALLDGDYDALEGAAFEDFRSVHQPPEPSNAVHVVPASNLQLRPYWYRWGSMDWGFEHNSAWYKFCATPEGRVVCYAEKVVRQIGALDQGMELAHWWRSEMQSQPDQQITIFLSKDAFNKRDDTKTQAERIAVGINFVLGEGSSFLATMTDDEKAIAEQDPTRATMLYESRIYQMHGRPGIILQMANNNRAAGANYIRECMNWRSPFEVGPPDMNVAHSILRAQGEVEMNRYLQRFTVAQKEATIRPRLQIAGPSSMHAKDGCPRLIETLLTRVVDEKNKESVAKVDGAIGDDEYDSFYYGMLGHRDIVNAAPRSHVLAEKMDLARQQYDDPAILDQIARYQAAKFDHEQRSQVKSMTLPRRGSDRHRRLQ